MKLLPITLFFTLLLCVALLLRAQTPPSPGSCPGGGEACTGNCQLNNVEALRSIIQSEVEAEVTRRIAAAGSIFQNCHQNRSLCNLTRLINDNRRLFCSTPSVAANITGYYTLDMRCEYSGGGQLEAPSLQRSSATEYFCQCSLLTPSSSGFATLSTLSPPPICSMVITRCPL